MVVATANYRNLPVSPKYSREIAYAIRGKKLVWAIKYLQDVIEGKAWVELRRHKKEVPHHYGKPRRRPVKAARYMLQVLENVKANALYRGADEEKLIITKIIVNRGEHKRPFGIARAFGARFPRVRGRKTHVFIEVSDEVSGE